MEVYLLGLIGAYVKLTALARIELGIAVYSFAALIVVMIAAEAALDPRKVWERLGPQAAVPLHVAATAPLLCAGITVYSPLRRWAVSPRRNLPHEVAVLSCGHYTSGRAPFKFIDGYILIKFLRANL